MRFPAVLLVMVLALAPIALALSSPVTVNGKTYYIATSTDPTEDTGDEVCAKAGLVCVGYTDKTASVCKTFHSGAATTSSVSGDVSGVYCDGSPQNGVCASETNACHTCPACSNTVTCSQTFGTLYREMFVECTVPPTGTGCSVSIAATDVNTFFNMIPGLNAQLQACPQALPSGAGWVIGNGVTMVSVIMNSNNPLVFSLTVTNGQITGIKQGAAPCTQSIGISENDFNTILQSTNKLQTAVIMISSKTVNVRGCTLFSSLRLFFTNPIARIIAARQAPPTPPPPKPQPNCGQLGEQCNNRACWSGMCGAPKENVNGQWRYVNYRCIDQANYTANCIGRGNTPPAWNCITGPCR